MKEEDEPVGEDEDEGEGGNVRDTADLVGADLVAQEFYDGREEREEDATYVEEVCGRGRRGGDGGLWNNDQL